MCRASACQFSPANVRMTRHQPIAPAGEKDRLACTTPKSLRPSCPHDDSGSTRYQAHVVLKSLTPSSLDP
eukprot:1994795-Amphidinium_carterae.2